MLSLQQMYEWLHWKQKLEWQPEPTCWPQTQADIFTLSEDALLLFKNIRMLSQNTKTWGNEHLSLCFCHCKPWQEKGQNDLSVFPPTPFKGLQLGLFLDLRYFLARAKQGLCPSKGNRLNEKMAACLSRRTGITGQIWSQHAEVPSTNTLQLSELTGSHSWD